MIVKFKDKETIIVLEVDSVEILLDKYQIDLCKYDSDNEYDLLYSLKIKSNMLHECLNKIDGYRDGVLDLLDYTCQSDKEFTNIVDEILEPQLSNKHPMVRIIIFIFIILGGILLYLFEV